jgi:glycosyltransferase involved in cell wall biosynthesis
VHGGVSNWIQMIIENFPEITFSILSVSTSREDVGEYKYEIPQNVELVKDIFLNEPAKEKKNKKVSLTKRERKSLSDMILGDMDDIDWKDTVKFLSDYRTRWEDLLMSGDFFEIAVRYYQQRYTRTPFADFLWTIRSIYMPLFGAIVDDFPKADIYHSVSTGYAGILGAIAKNLYGKPFVLTEHGIYTREREEEIIKSDWVKGVFKDIWIEQFYKLSKITYHSADKVITLFDDNRNIEIELGCPPEKIEIIANGIDIDEYEIKPHSTGDETDAVAIGAVVRVVPIKDIKTMILAFNAVKASVPGAKLKILGPVEEDPEYFKECLMLIESLKVADIEFTGFVKMKDYIGNMDILLLTSISEGQPLAVLEGMACQKPHVCTNVGGCRALLLGSGEDPFGPAGIVVPVMDVGEISKALIRLCKEPKLREVMGQAGRKRVQEYYRQDMLINRYGEIYSRYGGE